MSRPSGDADISGQPSDITCGRASDKSDQLDAAEKAYRKWFGDTYDLGVLRCVLAAAAAKDLSGDPPWLLVVGGSGAAKTETIMPLEEIGAVVVSTISGEAALLSGTSKKDRAKDATGGLLKAIGERGMLVIKDVTSILSMNRDTRASVLAALREVYDGSWSRNVGTDGGMTITWKGRLVVIGAVTTAWDSKHEVIAAMGDRFLLVRFSADQKTRRAASRQAMANAGQEDDMRKALQCAVGALLPGPTNAPIAATEDEIDQLFRVADLVTRARTAVERDFQGNPMYAHAAEMPTRFAKQLIQIMYGGKSIGMTSEVALAAALRCAGDSMPPLRLKVLEDVLLNPKTTVSDVAKRTQLPRKTVDRLLQELQLLKLLNVTDQQWGVATRAAYSIVNDGDAEPALKALQAERSARKVSTAKELAKELAEKLARNVSIPKRRAS